MQLKLTGIKLSALSTNVSKICTKLDFSGIQKYFFNVKLSGNSSSQIGASVGKFFDRFTVSFSFSLPAEWENVTMWNFLSQFVTLDQPTSRNWLKISWMRQHSTTSTKSLWSCNQSFRVSLIFSRIDCRNSWFGSSHVVKWKHMLNYIFDAWDNNEQEEVTQFLSFKTSPTSFWEKICTKTFTTHSM